MLLISGNFLRSKMNNLITKYKEILIVLLLLTVIIIPSVYDKSEIIYYRTPVLDNDTCKLLFNRNKPAKIIENKQVIYGEDHVYDKPMLPSEKEITNTAMKADEFAFDTTVNVARFLGLYTPKHADGNAIFGKITYDNGKIFFDEKLLPEGTYYKMRELCPAHR